MFRLTLSLSWLIICSIFLLLITKEVATGFLVPPRVTRKSTLQNRSPYEIQSLLLQKQGDSDKDTELNESKKHLSLDKMSGIRRRQFLYSLATAASTASVVTTSFITTADATSAVEDFSTAETAAKDISKTFPLTTKDFLLPPLDDRQYEYMQLPSNELRVLLVSDPSSSEAACCMSVHVGACSDSSKVQGLAHFHEHMLFLGTKEYPEEDSFESFLSTNGGSSNAYTDAEHTVYYFNMEAESGQNRLKEGLLRFGSFFTNPLFTESATGRELNAINSEHAKNLQSDSFRIFQIAKERASLKHPYSRFFTGNQQTLLDDVKKEGIDLRQELIDFNTKYYSSNQMILAVASPQPLQELKKMVKQAFGSIPNRKTQKPELAWQEQGKKIKPYNNIIEDSIIPSFGYVVEIIPVQQLRQVTLSWPVQWDTAEERDTASHYTKQADYITHILGHESPGSLLSYLKNKKNWANSLATDFNDELSDLSTIDLTIELTPDGLANLDKVISTVFGTIAMLRTTPFPDYIFEECLQLYDLDWRYATKGSPTSYVQSLSTNLEKYEENPRLVVAGPRRLAVSNDIVSFSSEPRTQGNYYTRNQNGRDQLHKTKKLVQQILEDYMTVENVLITAMSQSFAADERDFLTERWYGTKYRPRPIPQRTLQQWKDSVLPEGSNIAYPKPNRFIPNEKGLYVRIPVPLSQLNAPKSKSLDERLKPIPPPLKIRDDDRWAVYFKPDDRFGQPKAFVVFQLLSTETYDSPEKVALGLLYQQCATDRLQEYAYDATLAGLTYDLQILPRGIRVTFGGYNDKLEEFSTSVIQTLTTPSKILPRNKADLDRYQDSLLRGLSAFDVKQPYAHASYYAYLTLQPRSFQYSNDELRSAVSKITSSAQLESYIKGCWKRAAKAEALIQGNLSQQEALELINTIDNTLSFTRINDPAYYPSHLRALPLPLTNATPGTKLTITEPNPSNNNAAVHVMLQSVSRTVKDQMLIEILSAIVSEPFYNRLRTQQQLGYIVSSGLRALEDTRTLAFVVQSSKEPVSKLTREIINYLDSLGAYLANNISRATFGTYVKALIDRKTEPEKQLAAETTRHWSEISSGKFLFNRTAIQVQAALDLNKDDLIKFWDNLYYGTDDQKGRRILITELVPQNGAASTPTPPPNRVMSKDNNELGIDDISLFRKLREEQSVRS